MPDTRPDIDLDDRPADQRPPTVPLVDRPPERRPHVEKPKEKHRIHPDDVPPASDDDDAPDDDDADEKDDGGKDAGKGAKKDDAAKGPKSDKPKKSKNDKGDKDDSGDDDAKGGDDAPKTPVYKRPIFWIAIAVVIAGTIAGVLYWLHARDYESTDDAFIEGHVVQISPQVSARVLKVYIDDNTRVKAGDPMVDLDPTDYQVALAQAKGNEDAGMGRLGQAKAQVENSKSARDEAHANLDAANVAFENADRDLKRYEALDERARSKQQYDNAATAQKNASAQINQSKARLASAESQINVSVANVAAAQGEYETSVANRKQAEVNLGYCHITAAETGRITTKNVDPGMYAAAGQPIFAIVREDVWVVANFKETQLTNMRLNQPVTIKIDAYPDQEFRGHVESIQAGTGSRFSVLPAENATGNYVKVTQRIPVKIVFEEGQSKDPNRQLSPGLSVEPSVRIR